MSSAIRPSLNLPEVWLYLKPVDFRKSFLGLSAIVECEPGHTPFTGYLYVFTNRRRNKIKCLFRDDTGFVLYYKSLSEENEEKFKWPKGENDLMNITGQQINWLLGGYDISTMKPHKKLNYETVY